MFLLSIFSFDTLRIKRWSVAGPAVWLTMTGLMLLEVVVRIAVPAGQVPSGAWHIPAIRLQKEAFERMDRIDMLFAGSSIASVNISPTEFDDELQRRGVALNSFNTGFPGPDYEAIGEGFLRLYWRQRQSPVVVLVIAPNNLNEANTTVRRRTQEYLASFRRPLYAARAIDFISNFWLFGYRKELRQLRNGGWQFDHVEIDARGHTPMGEMRNPIRYDTTYEIKPDGVLVKALRQLVDRLRHEAQQVIIIEGISDSREREALSLEDRRNFDDILSRLSAHPGVFFIPTNDLTPPDEDFVDPIHLKSSAAQRYSRRLAQRFVAAGFPHALNSK